MGCMGLKGVTPGRASLSHDILSSSAKAMEGKPAVFPTNTGSDDRLSCTDMKCLVLAKPCSDAKHLVQGKVVIQPDRHVRYPQ